MSQVVIGQVIGGVTYTDAQVATALETFRFWSGLLVADVYSLKLANGTTFVAPISLFKPFQAVAFVAREFKEDSFNDRLIGDHDQAFGPCQWHWVPRGLAIFAATGIDVRSKATTHLQFLQGALWELWGPESAARQAIEAAKTIEEACAAVVTKYERAGAAGQVDQTTQVALAWAPYLDVSDTGVS